MNLRGLLTIFQKKVTQFTEMCNRNQLRKYEAINLK